MQDDNEKGNEDENDAETEVLKNSINDETNISYDDANLHYFYLSPSISD